MPSVIRLDDLKLSPTAALFEGAASGAGVSMFVVRTPPGKFVELHVHPYPETFLLLEGAGRWTAGDEVVELEARVDAGRARRQAARFPQHRRRAAARRLRPRARQPRADLPGRGAGVIARLATGYCALGALAVGLPATADAVGQTVALAGLLVAPILAAVTSPASPARP